MTALPAGSIGGVGIAPWGTIGLTLSSARSAGDAYAIDPQTLAVTRWTQSETGGLDPSVNSEPQLIEVASFDKEKISGFLYRPDPKKFPGKRPLLVNIHGGPESQFTPFFLSRSNYYLNELGIAIFYPNVRGSAGFGKRFVSLDNGPFKREDSVKDIGAFLEVLEQDNALDASRIGGRRRLVRRLHVLRSRDSLRRSPERRELRRRDLQFRDLPGKHPELSARPAARRVRRRARSRSSAPSCWKFRRSRTSTS